MQNRALNPWIIWFLYWHNVAAVLVKVYAKYSSNIGAVLAASLSKILYVFLVLNSDVLVVVVVSVLGTS